MINFLKYVYDLFLLYSYDWFFYGCCSFILYFILIECKELFDIIFVIDGFDSINKVDYEILWFVMEGMVDCLNIGDGNGWMGIVVYSRDIVFEVFLLFDKDYLKN